MIPYRPRPAAALAAALAAMIMLLASCSDTGAAVGTLAADSSLGDPHDSAAEDPADGLERGTATERQSGDADTDRRNDTCP